MIQIAQIIENYGLHYVVRLNDGSTRMALARQKRVDFACGDRVQINIINNEQAVIENYQPRTTLLYRQDAFKTKLIAANATQVLIVTAGSPAPYEDLLQRSLLACAAADLKARIVVNKMDLPDTLKWLETVRYYQEKLNIPLIALSALDDVSALRSILSDECTVLVGQSGMGKSTLINKLLNQEVARTSTISTALDSGRHTTTHTRLYLLDENSALMDSPGLQSFGLSHLNESSLVDYFPDLHTDKPCRFYNCTHRKEPDCALKNAAQSGEISAARLAFLQKITDEIEWQHTHSKPR